MLSSCIATVLECYQLMLTVDIPDFGMFQSRERGATSMDARKCTTQLDGDERIHKRYLGKIDLCPGQVIQHLMLYLMMFNAWGSQTIQHSMNI